jgi:hypothetical protein
MNELAEKKEILVDVVTSPEIILSEAQKAAQALTEVIKSKPKPVIIRGEQYLEFEDWQTVGRFYGLVPKVTETQYIQIGKAEGFSAKAVVVRTKDGMEISGAEAMCLNDEPNWKDKPMFMLKSMAQTRACAKALRNVLAWVVVLAGYKPTPAEEIIEVENISQNPPELHEKREPISEYRSETKTQPEATSKTKKANSTSDIISEAQIGYILGIIKKREWSKEDAMKIISDIAGREVKKVNDLTKEEAIKIITKLKKEPF